MTEVVANEEVPAPLLCHRLASIYLDIIWTIITPPLQAHSGRAARKDATYATYW